MNTVKTKDGTNVYYKDVVAGPLAKQTRVADARSGMRSETARAGPQRS